LNADIKPIVLAVSAVYLSADSPRLES